MGKHGLDPVAHDVARGFPDPRTSAIDPLRGARWVSAMHRAVPLGRKYHRLLRMLNGRSGFVAIPYEGFEAILPKSWSKSYTEHFLSQGGSVADFELVARHLASLRDGTLVDVGANFGMFTLRVRGMSQLPLVCFEPSPFVFALLQTTVERNRMAGVELRNEACGAGAGSIHFKPDINGHIAAAGEAGAIEVPVVALDEVFGAGRRVSFLKIDCEGFELQVLRGARRLLERGRPVLFVEIHPWYLQRYGDAPESVVELVRDGYELECFTFQHDWPASRLGRSWRKFQKPRVHRYASVEEMLAACRAPNAPSQIYLVGTPR
jgi:FkbM family methyltransferase